MSWLSQAGDARPVRAGRRPRGQGLSQERQMDYDRPSSWYESALIYKAFDMTDPLLRSRSFETRLPRLGNARGRTHSTRNGREGPPAMSDYGDSKTTSPISAIRRTMHSTRRPPSSTANGRHATAPAHRARRTAQYQRGHCRGPAKGQCRGPGVEFGGAVRCRPGQQDCRSPSAGFGAAGAAADEKMSQLVSGIAAAIGPFPAATLTGMALGIPHAHVKHPPSGPPPLPPIPLPPLGPILLGSMRMSESLEGASFARTLQNAGVAFMASGVRVTPAGGFLAAGLPPSRLKGSRRRSGAGPSGRRTRAAQPSPTQTTRRPAPQRAQGQTHTSSCGAVYKRHPHCAFCPVAERREGKGPAFSAAARTVPRRFTRRFRSLRVRSGKLLDGSEAAHRVDHPVEVQCDVFVNDDVAEPRDAFEFGPVP